MTIILQRQKNILKFKRLEKLKRAEDVGNIVVKHVTLSSENIVK